jgi:hypothetical protein
VPAQPQSKKNNQRCVWHPWLRDRGPPLYSIKLSTFRNESQQAQHMHVFRALFFNSSTTYAQPQHMR